MCNQRKRFQLGVKHFPIPNTAYGILMANLATMKKAILCLNKLTTNPWRDWQVQSRSLARSVLLGEWEIDRQFDRFAAAQEYDDIINNIDFIHRRSKESNSSAVSNHLEQYFVLNQEQQAVIKNFRDQFNGLTTIKRSPIFASARVGKLVSHQWNCEDYRIILRKNSMLISLAMVAQLTI